MEGQSDQARTRIIGHIETAVGPSVAQPSRSRVKRDIMKGCPDILVLKLLDQAIPDLFAFQEQIV
jgi:hypothetical protein